MIVFNNKHEHLKLISNTINTLSVALTYSSGSENNDAVYQKRYNVDDTGEYLLLESSEFFNLRTMKVSFLSIVNTGTVNHSLSLSVGDLTTDTMLYQDVVLAPKETLQYNEGYGFKIGTYYFTEAGAGTPGLPGSVWRSGSGVPSDSLGSNGDYYLRTSNGDVYYKSSSTYSVIGNIKGPSGDGGGGLPAGGTTNQVLSKINGTDYNTQWSTLTKSSVGLSNVPNLDTTAAVVNNHTHSNKALLDTYTQTEANIADAVTKKHSHANQTALDNVSGVNTGDQDLSNLVVKNTTITGATKTKITYDSKGLVTSSTDATTADIADSTNKRYVTDANLTTLGATSGTNTGDETTSSIQTKRPLKTVNGNSLEGSGDIEVGGTTTLTENQIAFGDSSNEMTSNSDFVVDVSGGAGITKIGINTSTPTSALEVIGDLKIWNGTERFLYADTFGFGAGDIDNNGDGNKLIVLQGDTAYYDKSGHNGKFGINTTTPTVALDVVGNVKISTLAGTGTRTVVAYENGILGIGSDGGSSAWGDITGTLADQTDLQDALDDKYPTSNPSEFITLSAISSTAPGLLFDNTGGAISLDEGYLIPRETSRTNWDAAYDNRITSLTTTGTGAATLVSNILNIPTPSIPSVGTWGALNFPTWTSGTPFVKMTAAGTFSLDSNTYYLNSNPSGYTSNLGTVTSFSFTNANGFTGSVSTSTVTPTLSLTLQNATTGQSGQLTSTDWNTFNNKQAALVSGTNIKTVNGNSLLGSGNISVGGMSWVEVTGTSQTASVNTGYILNNASLVTLTLPTTAAIGDSIKVVGKGAGGWKIAQPSGDIIYFGNLTSTTGTSGYLSSTHRRDTVELVCVTANTEWQVVSSIGNITVF